MGENGTKIPANARAIILLLLTAGLLCLYAWAVVTMISHAYTCNGDITSPKCVVTQRIATLTNTLQSLISAVVITVLAISPARGPLNLHPFGISETSLPLATILALVYVGAWFLIGAAALGVGTILLNDAAAAKFSALVEIGGAWLGLAMGAVYAYFGIDAKTSSDLAHAQRA